MHKTEMQKKTERSETPYYLCQLSTSVYNIQTTLFANGVIILGLPQIPIVSMAEHALLDRRSLEYIVLFIMAEGGRSCYDFHSEKF